MSQEAAIKASLKSLFRREGKPVTYLRGGDSLSIDLAVKGELRFQGQDIEGFTNLNQKWDFLIKTEDLQLDSTTFLPEQGDRIQITEGDVTREYRVSAPTAGEDCYRYSDRWFYVLRVHTSYVREVSE